MPARTVFIGCQPLVVQIILYAVLGVRFGREHRLAVHSCAEAIHALCVSIPGFKRFLRLSEERGLTFAVFRGKQNLSVDEMDMRSGRAEPIRIAPIVMGRKAGLFQTIAGIALIVVGAITQLYYLVAAGAGLAIGGVATLLSPSPAGLLGQEDSGNKASYASATSAAHWVQWTLTQQIDSREFPDGGENFPGASWDFRPGTVDQNHISGFPAVENEITQGFPIELRSDAAWTRAITDPQLSAVRIRLSWPQIWEVKTNGDQVGYRIDYVIELSVNGGSFQPYLNATLADKGTSEYERSHRVDLPEGFTMALVCVRWLTANRNDSNWADTMRTNAVTEVIDVNHM